VWVCPSDPQRGIAPTNFIDPTNAPGGQIPQTPGVQDNQAARSSYIANELVMPRKKYAAVPVNVVSDAAIDAPAEVIAVAEMTSDWHTLNDSSPTGGAAVKSHRPTNGVSDNGNVYDGESGIKGPVRALPIAVATLQIALAKERKAAGGLHHIVYSDPYRHSNGSNYAFTDGHAQWRRLEQTLDPNHFLWG